MRKITLRILVDNNPDPHGLCRDAWGLSIYVEFSNFKILFDTGPDPKVLQYNAEKLGIDLSNIDYVVISHGHGDHTRGLEALSKIGCRASIYVPKHTSDYVKNWIKDLNLNLVEIEHTASIAPNITIIGELAGPPYEQALSIKFRNNEAIILVGCSHPGIDKIVEKAIHELNIKPYLVVGGFHMWTEPESYIEKILDKLVSLNVEKIIPIHCSGSTIIELLKRKYPEKYVPLYTCSTYNLD